MTNHIKMPDIAPIIRYTANGTETVFSFPFPIFASEDLRISLDDAVQTTGFTVTGAGETAGGEVAFAQAPAQDSTIVIQRDMPLERMTDFLESGDFAARTLNNELDYLMASVQQVSHKQQTMLRFPQDELDAQGTLPSKEMRAGRALAFDSNGDPLIVPHGQTFESPTYIPAGQGAVTRALSDKAQEVKTPQDYGAKADGIHDDTVAIQTALQTVKHLVFPVGTYRITSSITIPSGCHIEGQGKGTIIAPATQTFPAFIMAAEGAMLLNLVIDQPQTGILFQAVGVDSALNLAQGITITNAETGIIVDGSDQTGAETDGTRIDYICIQSPAKDGVVLRQSNPSGLPPVNTHMSNITITSQGQTMTGCGMAIDASKGNTIISQSTVNVDGSAAACIQVGSDATGVCLDGVKTQSDQNTPNVLLAFGSQNTVIRNLTAGSDGAIINDQSGGLYQALFTQGLDKINAVNIGSLARDVDTFNSVAVSNSTTLNDTVGHVLVSGLTQDITLTLPAADSMAHAVIRLTRTDNTHYAVTVSSVSGADILLGNDGSHMVLFSDGTDWIVLSQSRQIGRTFSYTGGGTYTVDGAADLYLLSPNASGLTATLPAASSLGMKGRSLTFKNESGYTLTIAEAGASGPDGVAQILATQGDALTVMSNGSQWLIVSDYSLSSGGGAPGLTLRTTDISGAGTVTIDPNFDFFNVNNSSGTLRLNLPDPTLPSVQGRMLWFRKDDTSSFPVNFYDVNNNRPDNGGYNMNSRNETFCFCAHNNLWRLAHVYAY